MTISRTFSKAPAASGCFHFQNKNMLCVVGGFPGYFFEDLEPEVYIVLPRTRYLGTISLGGMGSPVEVARESSWCITLWARALIRSSTSRFERSMS